MIALVVRRISYNFYPYIRIRQDRADLMGVCSCPVRCFHIIIHADRLYFDCDRTCHLSWNIKACILRIDILIYRLAAIGQFHTIDEWITLLSCCRTWKLCRCDIQIYLSIFDQCINTLRSTEFSIFHSFQSAVTVSCIHKCNMIRCCCDRIFQNIFIIRFILDII